uniref:G patch domain-containing protein 4 n=1 Tax=Culicoides sonorensis TaxID=179676 RepID=A0A336KL33_CULSO
MNFGENLLKKYGWKEGEGLGKNNNGIVTAIKAHRKTNLAGLGSSSASDISGNNWWERVFDEASNNLNVEVQDKSIKITKKDEDGVEITNKSYSVKKLKEKSKDMTYGGTFLKAATLLADVGQEKEIENHVKTEDIQVVAPKTLTDEELFAACGKLTAHKGARHGLKLTGKLNRLAEQDNLLLQKIKQRNEPVQEGIFRELSSDKGDLKTPEWQNAKEKLKKPKFSISSVDDHPNVPEDELIDVLNIANYSKKSKKKRQKDRKTEMELIEKIEAAFDMTPKVSEAEDSDGDVVCDETQKIQKKSKVDNLNDDSRAIKKKKKNKKGKNKDFLTEKALEMIKDEKSDEIPTNKSSKKNKKKRKQEETLPTPPIIEPKNSKKRSLKADSESEESSDPEIDVVDRINEEMHHLSKKRRIEKSENFTTEFQEEHRKKSKKFKKVFDDSWETKGKNKKLSKNARKQEKKLCKKLEETISI